MIKGNTLKAENDDNAENTNETTTKITSAPEKMSTPEDINDSDYRDSESSQDKTDDDVDVETRTSKHTKTRNIQKESQNTSKTTKTSKRKLKPTLPKHGLLSSKGKSISLTIKTLETLTAESQQKRFGYIVAVRGCKRIKGDVEEYNNNFLSIKNSFSILNNSYLVQNNDSIVLSDSSSVDDNLADNNDNENENEDNNNNSSKKSGVKRPLNSPGSSVPAPAGRRKLSSNKFVPTKHKGNTNRSNSNTNDNKNISHRGSKRKGHGRKSQSTDLHRAKAQKTVKFETEIQNCNDYKDKIYGGKNIKIPIQFTIQINQGQTVLHYGYPNEITISSSGNSSKWRLCQCWGGGSKKIESKLLNFIGWDKIKSTGDGDIKFTPATTRKSKNQVPDVSPWNSKRDDKKKNCPKYAACEVDGCGNIEIYFREKLTPKISDYMTILKITGLKSDRWYLAAAKNTWDKINRTNVKGMCLRLGKVYKDIDTMNLHTAALRSDYLSVKDSQNQATKPFRSKKEDEKLLYNCKIRDSLIGPWGGWQQLPHEKPKCTPIDLVLHFGIAKFSVFLLCILHYVYKH